MNSYMNLGVPSFNQGSRWLWQERKATVPTELWTDFKFAQKLKEWNDVFFISKLPIPKALSNLQNEKPMCKILQNLYLWNLVKQT